MSSMRKHKIIRLFFNNLYKIRLPEFVSYWKKGDVSRAKLVTLEDGSYAMRIEGEKYPLYGFPRGPVLFGPLAKIKYLAKNLVFNQVWKMIEDGKPEEEIMNYIFSVARPVLKEEIKKVKYDMFPSEKLCPSVRELWRALSVIEKTIQNPQVREDFRIFKEGLTFFLQEDDAYRFRLQWMAGFLNPNAWWRKIYYLLKRKKYSFREELRQVFSLLKEAEITPDMRGRSNLIERVLFFFLDSEFGEHIEEIVKELNWKKLKLSKADTYYFRGKYFKVDYAEFDY